MPQFRRPPRGFGARPFRTGSDGFLVDPMIGIPTLWPFSGTGVRTHHNSSDTPDRVDARSLRDLSTVTAAFLYTVAAAGEPERLGVKPGNPFVPRPVITLLPRSPCLPLSPSPYSQQVVLR